ncbi:hypothetical protein [Peribacillus frigoritolerans]|uniref:hypothetical protein n=1 Tax=Peribacillus frigoritolerans TaxID=450367 RepID=UPI002E1DEDCC|nr:hypothetical protein [Peribacillus frigoritolerans]MED3845706.1 hypothetical protein [Peribacillus frigoritolerans]
MARGSITSISNSKSKVSKFERQARTEMEAKVANMAPSKPKPMFSLSKEQRKIFNRYVKLNDTFNEADSTSLTLLTYSMYRYTLIHEYMNTLDVLDERNVQLERRALAFDKAINTHMSALSIPLTQRLRMSNDMAKAMIEEKKLEQMEKDNQPKEVNPILQLLADMKKEDETGDWG